MRFNGRSILPWLTGILFLAGLAAHLHFATEGWHNTIGGPQDFRQSQTAIASYYIAEEGPMLATKVPVLGPHWRNPFEFPTFQTIVAALHKITGLPLDQTGRLVSLLSFYLCLIPMGILLKQMGFSRTDSLLVLLLVLSSPIYIFWSRTFLIETMALLFSLLFAVAVLAYLKKPYRWILVGGLVTGCLAALTKFTTFSIILGFIILFLVAYSLPEGAGTQWLRKRKTVIGIALALSAPVLAGWIWVQYINGVWLRAPLTRGQGEFIHQWNFGDWDLRDSVEFWGRFYEYSIGKVTYNFVPLLIGVGGFALATYRFRIIALCALAAWLSGPLVWANLFFVHDYYCTATGFFALVFISASLIGVSDRWAQLVIPSRILLAILAVTFMFYYPRTSYFESQVNDWGSGKAEFARQVGERVPDETVILVVGDDWNPMMAYYSEHYALMVRWKGNSESEEFAEVIRMLEAEKRRIGGAITRTSMPEMQEETQSLLKKFGLSPSPEFYSQNKEFCYYPLADNQ